MSNSNYNKKKIDFSLPNGIQLSALLRQSSRARHIRLFFDESGRLILSAPENLSITAIKKYSRDFIPALEKAAKLRAFPNPERLPREVPIPLLNQIYSIKKLHGEKPCQDKSEPSLFREDTTLWISSGNEGGAILGLQKFFWSMASNCLPPFLLALAKGQKDFSVKIKNQRTRLGSCIKNIKNYPQTTITLNWRVLLLPVELVEHLCWHEITHITHMNHSPEYYRLLETNSPKCREKEKRLTQAWKNLPAWTRYRGI